MSFPNQRCVAMSTVGSGKLDGFGVFFRSNVGIMDVSDTTDGELLSSNSSTETLPQRSWLTETENGFMEPKKALRFREVIFVHSNHLLRRYSWIPGVAN